MLLVGGELTGCAARRLCRYESRAQALSDGSDNGDNTDAGGGGGVAIEGDAEVNMTGCAIHSNNALEGRGAGVLIKSGAVRFKHVKIFRNGVPPAGEAVPSLFRAGGGVRIEGGSVAFESCDVDANLGSGLAVFGKASVVVNDTKIHDNNATEGGGVHQGGGASLFRVADSRIFKNVADKGGGLFVGNASITGTEIKENFASTTGGGLFVRRQGAANVANSQVIHNKAGEAGGGAYVWYQAEAKLADSVFKQNAILGKSEEGRGSGVYARCSSTVRLARAVFEANPPGDLGGDDVFVDASADCPAADSAVVCTEDDATWATVAAEAAADDGGFGAHTLSPSVNITDVCPLVDDDEPSAVGCVTGHACAAAKFGGVLVAFLVVLLGALMVCGWAYKKTAAPDETSPLVDGKKDQKQEYRCSPGWCISACLSCLPGASRAG